MTIDLRNICSNFIDDVVLFAGLWMVGSGWWPEAPKVSEEMLQSECTERQAGVGGGTNTKHFDNVTHVCQAQLLTQPSRHSSMQLHCTVLYIVVAWCYNQPQHKLQDCILYVQYVLYYVLCTVLLYCTTPVRYLRYSTGTQYCTVRTLVYMIAIMYTNVH